MQFNELNCYPLSNSVPCIVAALFYDVICISSFPYPAVNISLSQSTYSTYELAGHVEVCARLLIEVLDKSVHVILSTEPGTATGRGEWSTCGHGVLKSTLAHMAYMLHTTEMHNMCFHIEHS